MWDDRRCLASPANLPSRAVQANLSSVDAPLIATSARTHGIHDDDMIHAFNHPILVDDLDDGLTMFGGADAAGSLLEVGVIDSSDGPIVIHAMPARPKYLR